MIVLLGVSSYDCVAFTAVSDDKVFYFRAYLSFHMFADQIGVARTLPVRAVKHLPSDVVCFVSILCQRIAAQVIYVLDDAAPFIF